MHAVLFCKLVLAAIAVIFVVGCEAGNDANKASGSEETTSPSTAVKSFHDLDCYP